MAEQMQRTVSCLGVFVKAGALLEFTRGVFNVPWPGGPAVLCSPGRVPAGFLAAGLLWALAVTPGCARTHIFGGPTFACPPFSEGW